MIAKWIRKVFGSIRFFMALLALTCGMAVVLLCLFKGYEGSAAMWAFLSSLVAGGTGYIWSEHKRPSGEGKDGNGPGEPKDGPP